MGETFGLLLMALLSLQSGPAKGDEASQAAPPAQVRCATAAPARTQACGEERPQPARPARVRVQLRQADAGKAAFTR